MKAMNGKKVIKGICFVLVFVVLFYFAQRLLQVKWVALDEEENPATTSAWIEYRDLDKNSIDVLFLGTSHSYSAIDPMYIYEKTGITSYVFGGPGLRMDLTYMSLAEALKTQNPSVVFLDMSALQYDSQLEEAKCHKVLDQLSMSKLKLEYAFNNGSEDMKPLDAIFPFFRYHTRWTEIGEDDYKYMINDLNETYVRGHFVNYEIVPTELHFYDNVEYHLMDRNLEYITKIKELCDEKNIELIFYKIPTPQWYESWSKGAEELGEKFDVPYLELFYKLDEMGVDPNKDFRDLNEHMNQYGAEKVSNYLAEYIEENYHFTDQRSENKKWNEDLAKYKELLKKKEIEQTQIQAEVQ